MAGPGLPACIVCIKAFSDPEKADSMKDAQVKMKGPFSEFAARFLHSGHVPRKSDQTRDSEILHVGRFQWILLPVLRYDVFQEILTENRQKIERRC